MSISAYDSRIFRNLFSTQGIRDIFSDEAYAQRMIEVEAALACAQSKTGVIPEDVGVDVMAAAKEIKLE